MTIWLTAPTLAFAVTAAWFISEVALGRLKHSKGEGSSAADQSSLKLLWITIMSALTVGIFLGISRIGYVDLEPMTISYCGVAFVIAGLGIRWIAILSLRKYFTTDVSIQSEHRLIDSGLYGIVRHPSYTGTLLSFLGLGLSFANWLSTVVIVIPILFAFLYRIRVEEQALSEHFGESYAAYSARVKRLLPLIY